LRRLIISAELSVDGRRLRVAPRDLVVVVGDRVLGRLDEPALASCGRCRRCVREDVIVGFRPPLREGEERVLERQGVAEAVLGRVWARRLRLHVLRLPEEALQVVDLDGAHRGSRHALSLVVSSTGC
jgi:hypothetical protein